jgi:alkylated DNA nucleotide flippase Atl1
MPFKICHRPDTAEEQIQKLRQQIKTGEGMTMAEVAQALGTARPTVSAICSRLKLTVPSFVPGIRNAVNLLVNPQDLKKYAGKNSRT